MATGKLSSHTVEATRIDHANSGTLVRPMPGVRNETTVVARQMAASSSDTITMPVPSRVSSMASASSPVTPSRAPQPPPASTEMTVMAEPSR